MKTLTVKIGIQSLIVLGIGAVAFTAHAQTSKLPITFTEPERSATTTPATTTSAQSAPTTTPRTQPEARSATTSAASSTPAETATSTSPAPVVVEETPPILVEETPPEETPVPAPVVKPLVPEEKEEEIATSTPILPISGIAGIFSGPTQFTGIYATEGPLSRKTTRTLLQIAFASALLGFLLVEKRTLDRTGALFIRTYSRLPIFGRRIGKA